MQTSVSDVNQSHVPSAFNQTVSLSSLKKSLQFTGTVDSKFSILNDAQSKKPSYNDHLLNMEMKNSLANRIKHINSINLQNKTIQEREKGIPSVVINENAEYFDLDNNNKGSFEGLRSSSETINSEVKRKQRISYVKRDKRKSVKEKRRGGDAIYENIKAAQNDNLKLAAAHKLFNVAFK